MTSTTYYLHSHSTLGAGFAGGNANPIPGAGTRRLFPGTAATSPCSPSKPVVAALPSLPSRPALLPDSFLNLLYPGTLKTRADAPIPTMRDGPRGSGTPGNKKEEHMRSVHRRNSLWGAGKQLTCCAIALAVALLFSAAIPSAHAAGHRRVLLSQATAAYPEIARRMRVSGPTTLMVTILPNGSVAAVQTRSGHPLLLRAAEEAIRQWRYAPADETSTISVTINFDLKP